MSPTFYFTLFFVFHPYRGIISGSTVVREYNSRVLFSLFATDFEGPGL